MLISLRSPMREPPEVALSNPLTADHVGNGRHAYIQWELGQRLYHCLVMRGMSSSPVSLTMGVCVDRGLLSYLRGRHS